MRRRSSASTGASSWCRRPTATGSPSAPPRCRAWRPRPMAWGWASASKGGARSEAFRHLLQHHLGGAAADGLDARVARHALDRAFAHEAHAAMELHAVIDQRVDELAAIGLQHRHLAGDVVALGVAPRGGIDELAPGFELGRAHGETLTDRLLVPERPAEGLARLQVGERQLERRLRLAHRHGADDDALVLEVPHDRVEAATFLAEHRVMRDQAILEQQLGGVRRAPAMLVERAADAKARRALL